MIVIVVPSGFGFSAMKSVSVENYILGNAHARSPRIAPAGNQNISLNVFDLTSQQKPIGFIGQEVACFQYLFDLSTIPVLALHHCLSQILNLIQ